MRRGFLPLLALSIFTGCYTVLRHPAVDTQPPQQETVAVRSDCAACHSDWELDGYGYAFHPGWYPVYGAWTRWYSEPWWRDVAATKQPPAAAGVQVEQGAGLQNDRRPQPTAPGIWMPGGAPSGTGTLLPPEPQPVQAPAVTSPPGPGPRSGSPAAAPARGATTPAGPQPAEQLDAPRGGAAPSTPASRNGQPSAEPRSGSHSTPPAETGAAAPQPAPPAPSPEPHVEPQPSQGRGMTNDRGGPKP